MPTKKYIFSGLLYINSLSHVFFAWRKQLDVYFLSQLYSHLLFIYSLKLFVSLSQSSLTVPLWCKLIISFNNERIQSVQHSKPNLPSHLTKISTNNNCSCLIVIWTQMKKNENKTRFKMKYNDLATHATSLFLLSYSVVVSFSGWQKAAFLSVPLSSWETL